MLTSYNKLVEIYEDSARLVKFLGVLRKFNFGMPLNDDFQTTMIEYFNYRWQHYKYHVFRDEYENITMQLPPEHIDVLLRTMVYRPFIDRYQHVL